MLDNPSTSQIEADIRYLTVSEVVKALNTSLERNFPNLQFEAEISQVSRPASGHVYFNLKDDKSQIAAVMWRGMAETLQFKLEPGLKVYCQGRPNIFQAQGRLQVVVNKISPAGEGLLQKKFLELKAKLEKEGFFAPQRKRALPFLPKAVGVVTSGTGAVIHDIMVKFNERMPCLKVYLAAVRVQGEGSAAEIADGVKRLSDSGLVDVIIVARGGGSLEDLWSFNEEIVVKAIFMSKVPVVSGVGHEVDITLSDLVADVRAPTPTAAAEFVVPKRTDLLARIDELQARLLDYAHWFMPLNQRVDELELRMINRVQLRVEEARAALLKLDARLRSIQPDKVISMLYSKLEVIEQKLYGLLARQVKQNLSELERRALLVNQALQNFMLGRKHALERSVSRFQALDPRQVLKRGYSVVEADGALVTSSAGLKLDQVLGVRFFEGQVRAKVLDKI